MALRRCAPVLRCRPRHGNVLRLRGQAGRHRRGGTGRGGSDPPVQGPGTGSGPGVFAHLPPPSWGRSRAIDPSRKGVGPMTPATLAIIGTALGAAAGHAFRAPFPGMGGNPVLDLIAYHNPGFHTVIRVWYYAAPAVAVVLAGSVCLSVWRVWLQPPARGGGRGTLPPWPASPEDDAPSLVVGELHHPTVPRESERPSWLVVPETGLYTGVLIVGAVGSGKTTACMYPFAQQLLSWQADRAGRRASALVLEVKGDFCHKSRRANRWGRSWRTTDTPRSPWSIWAGISARQCAPRGTMGALSNPAASSTALGCNRSLPPAARLARLCSRATSSSRLPTPRR